MYIRTRGRVETNQHFNQKNQNNNSNNKNKPPGMNRNDSRYIQPDIWAKMSHEECKKHIEDNKKRNNSTSSTVSVNNSSSTSSNTPTTQSTGSGETTTTASTTPQPGSNICCMMSQLESLQYASVKVKTIVKKFD